MLTRIEVSTLLVIRNDILDKDPYLDVMLETLNKSIVITYFGLLTSYVKNPPLATLV